MAYFNLKSAYDDTIIPINIGTYTSHTNGVLEDVTGYTDIVATLYKDISSKKTSGSISYYAEVPTGYENGPTITYSLNGNTLTIKGGRKYQDVLVNKVEVIFFLPSFEENYKDYMSIAMREPKSYGYKFNTYLGVKHPTDWYPVIIHDGAGDGGGAGGPTSGPGGGGGNFDNTSDTISAPSGNIKGLVDSGMLGIFAPSEAQLKEFAGFLWSNNIFDQIKKYNDPLDMIISLTQIPTSPPIAGNGVVKIGNVLLSETFTLPYVSNQFFEFDMGEISIPEYWGNFLDYSPYTNIQIYLPYIGFREISTDDVMGGTIKLKYVIDCISGTCLGILEVVKKDFNAVLYQWTGNCSMEIPLTGRRTKVDFSSLFSILGTAAGGAAIGGAAGAAVSSGLGAVNAISQSSTKPIISRSGNISSNGGFAGVQTPYIVISRKIQSLPDQYQTFDGYPANISSKLSDLKGFVKVSKIHLDGIPCTESELDEINDYLTGGIII